MSGIASANRYLQTRIASCSQTSMTASALSRNDELAVRSWLPCGLDGWPRIRSLARNRWGPFRYGQLDLTVDHIAQLQRLSEACGGWIVFDDDQEETFVPIDRWRNIYRVRPRQLAARVGHVLPFASDRFPVVH